ncbi:AAA ATPase midasin [Purpureocillium takamizusanense]|uniref:Midasin n=1 Tax=Purpureocillium takamizusanense TaxID=2060973 RepID=A0A9Q8V5V5_9HYPO|nr:AAA ATPase midasin [Purpureocillium takamizusanense]UNI14165.1 AAA ATPase midasin [Purpureocillium takamizusanense]
MDMIDVSRQTRSLLRDATALDHLPPDLLGLIRNFSSTNLLDAISQAALIPRLTERVFVHFEDVFPDLCARWILNAGNDTSRHIRISSAFARILPFAPYLSNFLTSSAGEAPAVNHPPALRLQLPTLDESTSPSLSTESLLESLVTIWRLLSFDSRTFTSIVSLTYVQSLFVHESRAVRYVAIRIFCQLLHASDLKLENLVDAHVGKDEAVIAALDGRPIDFGFLSLHEHDRAKAVIALRSEVERDHEHIAEAAEAQSLTPYVVPYGRILLPRPHGPIGDPSSLVRTATTTKNLEALATMLREPDPILLHGLPGVGKTSLIHEIARQLGMYSNMVTLHLNEQTDAKMLVGLYSTDSKPGSFQWRPGVLTTAVREGRWVLVEDLDRAPTEVLSTLLPLIERKELLIPSRGERIRAANSFRLFATVRTSRGMNGRENLPTLVGIRFWRSLCMEALTQPELEDVVLQTYPILRKFVPGILAVHRRLSHMANNLALMSRGRSVMDRQINLRDLLKWCRRLRECLLTAGSTSGDEPISETTRDWMFMEALDCFVGSCPDVELGKNLVYAIAEEMHMSKERADHYLSANIPPLEESEFSFNIGRAQLRKKKTTRLQKSKRPFASTAHAKRLLEQIAVAVKLEEPVLLVGETGIGKTTVVQQLAESLGHRLIAVNLSQQSEVGDLLGGFKPVNVRSLAVPLKEEFEDLFAATGISASKNQKYLEQFGRCFAKGQWSKLSKLWKEAPKMFVRILMELERMHSETRDDDAQPNKRRKTQSKLQTLSELRPRWDTFARNLEQFDVQIAGGSGAFAFSFVEGNLVKAVRNGDWVLLDEINLASPDTLESIADLLTGPDERPCILLSETGEIEKIVAHPNFRIFGAMNPATDIGKRDLPVGIRSRFTELYVGSPDADLKDLLTIIKTYLGSTSMKHDQAADDIARLYLNTKRMAEEKRLVDGANEVPHFSLRTLTRVLSYVNTIAPLYGVRRALYEGFSMGFLTLLDRDSERMLLPLIYHHLLDKHGDPHALLSQTPKHPNDGRRYVRFQNQNRDRQYWLFQGEETPVRRDDYIITPYVERNLLNLVRATSTRRFPILIQGPTSAGKTSMIEYLANFTGNKFVRINNHEHTDLQEYLGTYVSGPDGKLRFQEGLLVQAMREGHWIVLDELNLAPTDVLEALNRLLDDNRELLIPETQEVVRPHENFILFATQNPPGLYGGRKVLSRAFRNRFLELHFDDIPEDELEYILQQRSRNTSPPDCRRIVTVYKELSRLRQTSRLFEQKDSFATLRDLFRWALREAETRDEIATHGFMLLAERVRNEEERLAVKEVIERVFKLKIDPHRLYAADVAPELRHPTKLSNAQGVVWTHAMRRLYVLVSRALRNNEPVLLVGETGCGKTTVCQLLAEALQKELHIVNAHQNTETGDLIGSQRPIRNRGAILEALDADLRSIFEALGLDATGSVDEKVAAFKALQPSALAAAPAELIERVATNESRAKALFEWSDGALVEAMRGGHYFLLDEISLADDSVLERLNSVLEPQRTLLLAEKGIDNSFVVGSEGFQFFATMNPGGDFGKKELSPALRNRFTEIWVPPLSESDDIYEIVRTKLADGSKHLVDAMVQFASWFGDTFRSMATTRFSVREILVWVQFINTFESQDPVASVIHGASAIFIDSIGANPSAMLATDLKSINQQRMSCLVKLGQLLNRDVVSAYESEPVLVMTDSLLSIGNFSTPRTKTGATDSGFAFDAPTTRLNAMRVLRALQMRKPILLEGSPGVGKTSLVAALSQACGRPLTRINLSDQTDLMDLFGTDVPVEGEEVGNFAWRDAPFLQAMQKGEWVLLDEMNLASQSVLEGLNACLDHRGEVYISELDQVFKRHPDFRLFAAQNPHHQGGGRKGLPASFVNRFIVVYADVLKDEDLKLIASHNFPKLSAEVVRHLIDFVSEIDRQLVVEKTFGVQGGPWEFNVRDVLRWLNLLNSSDPLLQTARVDDFLDILVRQRFRTQKDREEVSKLFAQVVGWAPRSHHLYHDTNSRFGQVGLALLRRNLNSQPERLPTVDVVPRLSELESVMICVEQNIPCILSSTSGFGKSTLLRFVAAMAGKPLTVFPMNADIDTMDLVGGFEQADPLREINSTLRDLSTFLKESAMRLAPATVPAEVLRLLHLLDRFSGNVRDIAAIHDVVESLSTQVAADSEVGIALSKSNELLRGPLALENPRFEWLDGVIVKALESGQWLVLDNANMCNASVLDRLNSLLEPNGFLSINEHCDSDGKPRIIRPHPEFRIFLTMDPRYGELSRAMRNRAIEIHISTPPPVMDMCFDRMSSIESRLQRYKDSWELCQEFAAEIAVSRIAVDNLSLQDVSLLSRFINQPERLAQDGKSLQGMREMLQFLQSKFGSDILRAIIKAYSTLPQVASSALSSVQPIHMLGNPRVSQLLPINGEPQWMAIRYEFTRVLHGFHSLVEEQRGQARSAKLATLSRLQRSLISDRVAVVSKDSTVKLAMFLSAVIGTTLEYLASEFASLETFQERAHFVRLICLYIGRTLRLSMATEFDEAQFQAHLALGAGFLQSQAEKFTAREDNDLVGFVRNRLHADFNSGFKLSTGLSMEVLWNVLRPTPIPDKSTLDRILDLDQLGVRFDAIRWKASASIDELTKAQQTLRQAYEIVRGGIVAADGLVNDLTSAIQSLEAKIGDDETDFKPFFATEFEALRQLSMLRHDTLIASYKDLDILSSVPTKALMLFTSSKGAEAILQSVDCLVHQDVYSWDGKLVPSLWSKMQNMSGVSIRSLALLEAELPAMGRSLSGLSAQVMADPLESLNETLWHLIVQVFAAHGSNLRVLAHAIRAQATKCQSFAAQILREGLPTNNDIFDHLIVEIEALHLRDVARSHLIPAIIGIMVAENDNAHRAQFCALAWIQFSVGLVKLYVPDRIFDPQLRPRAELDFFQGLQTQLQDSILALKAFEKSFTGQGTSVRIDLVEQELAELGPLPEQIQPVYRPKLSELTILHAEFSNILKTVVDHSLSSAGQHLDAPPVGGSDGLHLVRENVKRLIDRLSSRFDAYQDMTRPAVNALRCLSVGLSLCDTARAHKLDASTEELVKATPFFGGRDWDFSAGTLSSKSFEYLSLMVAKTAVEGRDNLPPHHRELIFGCFHGFYDDWSKKLEADRKSAAANTSLYRFRGSEEDEEEIDQQEFNELFPTYDDDDVDATRIIKPDQVRDMSIKVAEVHSKIFLDSPEPPAAIREACMAVGCRVARETSSQPHIERTVNRKLLVPTMLLLNDKLDELQSPTVDNSYNFYTDANLAEARKLVVLAYQIKSRFQELQLVDEIGHMQPLADVVQSCDKLLDQAHDEPLAKMLPKVEQLHAHVYEWQFGGWASKVHAVLSLHDALTDTVIRWRRLELSTWANLFEMEQKKCQDDAFSWWFVAYQVVVAVPLSMVDSTSDLREYAPALIQNLELYFSSSIVGQFKTRVSLLRQLLGHLRLLVKDYPKLNIICHAVENFVDFYARYEPAAESAIQRGRQPIEKKMKDVLLMASWKDTNINALRESARKSHQKLFRVVRKFRGVLGQEMKSIVQQGLPDEGLASDDQKPPAPAAAAALQQKIPMALEEALPGWLEKHRRLANVSMTVSVLRKITHGPEMTTSAARTVDDFVSELDESMAELRKETPAFLNKENTEQVKHLKTRKRKLFADTLRDLRNMGLKHNLGQDRLMEQASLAVVLGSIPPVHHRSSATLRNAEYFFHKTLDFAPRARAAAQEHSEELTGAEIGRSIGFMEGMIHLGLSQRKSLSTATEALCSLRSIADDFIALGDSEKTQQLARQDHASDWSLLLPWLAQMIRLAVRVTEAHGKLGQTDNQHVVQELELWAARVETYLVRMKDLGTLPPGILSETHKDLEVSVLKDLCALQMTLDGLIAGRPALAFILQQLRVWTQAGPPQPHAPTVSTEILAFANEASTLTDTILVAVESARKKATSAPKEDDEAGWLQRHNDICFATVSQLHMKRIEKGLRNCIHHLRELDLNEPRIGSAAASVIGLATPIIGQFVTFCQQSVERGIDLHRACVHMAFFLTKSFTQIASQGFCTPQEKSDETSGDAGQVESGTGLGDGEGAEDISKDIQPDEDLLELAQEANKEENGEIEDEKDAVDMADEDLEGEMGSIAGETDDEEGSQKGEEDEKKDIDEEAGDVDDLDPTAVDEKMWDGDDDKAEKDQQGDKGTGQKQDDEQMAADENANNNEAEQEPESKPTEEPQGDDEAAEENPVEEEDVTAPEELNRQDQNVDENDALELPEEMDLDFDDQQEVSDDDLADLSDIEEDAKEAEAQPQEDPADEEEGDNAAAQQVQDEAADDEGQESEPEDEKKATGEERVDEEPEPEPEDADKETEHQDQAPLSNDNANADTDNAAPSDVKSSGLDQNADAMDLDEQFQAEAAQQEHGEIGDGATDQDTNAGNKGATSRNNDRIEQTEQDASAEESARSDPFRKLGDALEKWHRQQADIKDASSDDDRQQAERKAEAEQGRQEFQHLQNDDAAADTQAMGTAEDEEAQPIDESMAVEEDKQDPSSRVMNEDVEEPAEGPDGMDLGDSVEAEEAKASEVDNDRSGVKTRQGNYNREPTPEPRVLGVAGDESEESHIEETSTQLSSTHITDERPLRDYAECMRQWSEFQTKSHALSLSLTSQLRLILTPSQSTKLSGSFRTGKRLNIKRIIPYIASSYKRDKIWMRRAVPTKRTYQILVCVDDSKSMGESSSGSLAMESLVMVSRSLTMLEAGHVGVVGFGGDVFTAHELAEPFGADAGAKVLQKFSFGQDRTDIAQLIRRTIDMFRMARQQSGGSSDLWQLALILSDGLTPSSAHDSIRRLLREAMEERIMIVFIIMDDTGKKKGDSVLELKEAKFVKGDDGESKVVIERYLDTFPFQYYLIVHQLEELPSALAGLLRTWFAEVTA